MLFLSPPLSFRICILFPPHSPQFNSFMLCVLIYVADRNKDKQKNALFCSPGKKKTTKKQKQQNN